MSSKSLTVKHLRPRQVAERWCITEGTLERWRTSGVGPVYLRLPGRVVYRVEDIEAFERQALCVSTSRHVHAKEHDSTKADKR